MPFFSQLWEIGLSPQLNPHPPPPATPYTAPLPLLSLLSPPSLFTQAQGYNASLSLTSDQCRGHGGGGWGWGGLQPIHYSSCLFLWQLDISILFRAPLYSAMSFFARAPCPSTRHQKPQVLTEIRPLYVHHRNCDHFVCLFPQ